MGLWLRISGLKSSESSGIWVYGLRDPLDGLITRVTWRGLDVSRRIMGRLILSPCLFVLTGSRSVKASTP